MRLTVSQQGDRVMKTTVSRAQMVKSSHSWKRSKRDTPSPTKEKFGKPGLYFDANQVRNSSMPLQTSELVSRQAATTPPRIRSGFVFSEQNQKLYSPYEYLHYATKVNGSKEQYLNALQQLGHEQAQNLHSRPLHEIVKNTNDIIQKSYSVKYMGIIDGYMGILTNRKRIVLQKKTKYQELLQIQQQQQLLEHPNASHPFPKFNSTINSEQNSSNINFPMQQQSKLPVSPHQIAILPPLTIQSPFDNSSLGTNSPQVLQSPMQINSINIVQTSLNSNSNPLKIGSLALSTSPIQVLKQTENQIHSESAPPVQNKSELRQSANSNNNNANQNVALSQIEQFSVESSQALRTSQDEIPPLNYPYPIVPIPPKGTKDLQELKSPQPENYMTYLVGKYSLPRGLKSIKKQKDPSIQEQRLKLEQWHAQKIKVLEGQGEEGFTRQLPQKKQTHTANSHFHINGQPRAMTANSNSSVRLKSSVYKKQVQNYEENVEEGVCYAIIDQAPMQDGVSYSKLLLKLDQQDQSNNKPVHPQSGISSHSQKAPGIQYQQNQNMMHLFENIEKKKQQKDQYVQSQQYHN